MNSMLEVEWMDETSAAIAGRLPGARLEHPLSGGLGKNLLTALGAAGGAVGQYEVEKSLESNGVYRTTVRFEDGSRLILSEPCPPTWRSAERCGAIGGRIQSSA